MMIPAELKKWLAFGSGVGIEITGPPGAETLRIAALRIRPQGTKLLGSLMVENAPQQPAGVWGTDYSAFLRKLAMGHVAATVILPRRDVTVRQIAMPAISDKDLAAAIRFQLDGLHPYPEDEAIASWARLPGSGSVLVAVTRRPVIERFTTLFAEAGIKIQGFSCSAAAVYSARRLFGSASSPIFALERATESNGQGLEIYGESAARPVFSATFNLPAERAAALATAELRLEPGTEPVSMEALLGAPVGEASALAFAAAMNSACPWLGLPVNLLPGEMRTASSRAPWIPASALAGIAVLLAVAYAVYPQYDRSRYLKSLEAEMAKIQPQASRSAALDRTIAGDRARIFLLDQVRGRARADMDVVQELTHILAPPTWVNLLEVTRAQITVGGETDQAAPLLRTIDASPLFQSSEFAMPPVRIQSGEGFRIRTRREAGR